MNKNNNFKGLNENSIIVYFHHKENYRQPYKKLETYHIVYNYIYVLNKSSLDELFVTYNIDSLILRKPLGHYISS